MVRRYKPWCGDNYSRPQWRGVRLLLLGESHYGDEDPNATIKWTKAYIGGGSGSFWTRTMQIVTGKHHSALDRESFWHDVAFANYIQEPVGDGPRIRPTEAMWSAAEGAFWQTLRELRPTHLLVLGKALWSNLPSAGESGPPLRIGQDERETWIYPIAPSGRVLATWIYHPSSGKGSDPKRSHAFVRKFLDLSAGD